MANLEHYENQLKGKKCKNCGTALTTVIRSYEHPGGYEVDGYSAKRWLYTECPKCEYQNALHKLGIAELAPNG